MRIADSHFNRLLLLRELRRREPVSRTELTAATGLNGATVSGIVGDLVARGVVVEQRIKPSGSGRPRLNLRLSSRALFTVTAIISGQEGLRVGIADLRGEIVETYIHPVGRTTSFTELSEHISGQVDQLLRQSGIDRQDVLNVQVGLPAVVERTTGVVHYFETFEPGPFDMRTAIESRLGIATSIDHGMSLLAACEHWYGNDANGDDFMLLTLDLGIALTAYRNGMLYTGRNGFEPEFGHSKIFASGGRPCRCGSSGCLEVYSSMSAILGQLGQFRFDERVTPSELFESFDRVVLPGGQPSPVAAPHLAEAGACLGTAIANLINLEGPDRIVLLLPSQAFADAIAAEFEQAVHRDTFPPLRGRTRVDFRVLVPEMYIRGGAALTLERLYQSRTEPETRPDPQ